MDSLLKSLGTMVMALLRRRKKGKLVRPPRDIALQDGVLAPASGPTEKPHWQKAKGSLLHPAVKTASCVLSVFTHVRLFVTPRTVAHQAPLSMGFSRKEYWSGLPCPPPGDLPDSGIEPVSLTSPALAGFFTTSANWEATG